MGNLQLSAFGHRYFAGRKFDQKISARRSSWSPSLLVAKLTGLSAVQTVQNPQEDKMEKGKYVVVRTYSAGVHCGFLEAGKEKEVTLKNARRLWYWVGAFTLNAVANNGVKEGSKISAAVSEIVLTEAIEIIACTDVAQKNLETFFFHVKSNHKFSLMSAFATPPFCHKISIQSSSSTFIITVMSKMQHVMCFSSIFCDYM